MAQYTMPAVDLAMNMSTSNNFTVTVSGALGRERADLIGPSAGVWLSSIYSWATKPTTMVVKRFLDGRFSPSALHNKQAIVIRSTSRSVLFPARSCSLSRMVGPTSRHEKASSCRSNLKESSRWA